VLGEIELIEKAAKRVGITSLLNHGAASCVYSEGCAGVSQEHLLAYTREIALHCAVALAAPQPEAQAPACKGTNCSAVRGVGYSQECEAEHDRATSALDTAGNRNPEARYAGYKGQPASPAYTADQLAAWQEGTAARTRAKAPQPEAAMSPQVYVTRNTLLWWKNLAVSDPQSLIPSIDAALAALAKWGTPTPAGEPVAWRYRMLGDLQWQYTERKEQFSHANEVEGLSNTAPPVRERWQPIETAPRDVSVIVYPPTWSEKSCAIAKYNSDQFSKKPRPYWARGDDLGKIEYSRAKPPTHWMPLPPPPIGITKGEPT
jgi:hypothetical protein